MLRETNAIPEETDVLVLGAGMAGHCAALAAAEAGSDVLLLEKSAQPGGSSAIAGGAFVFCGTEEQLAAGQEDSLEALRQDLLASGKNKNNPELIDRFLMSQLDTYHFLRNHGVKFQLHRVPAPAVSRAHVTGTGRAITMLHMAAQAEPRIHYYSKSAGIRLRRSSDTGRVEGALVMFGDREVFVRARGGVVLATGGFSRSRELLQTYAPELAGAVKHGGIANTGDGLMMASDLGAGHADLGYVSGSFGGGIRNYPDIQNKADEIPPLLFSFLEGGIMVNKSGARFANEGQSYKALSNIGMAQPEGIGFQVFDNRLMQRSHEDTSVNNYKEALLAGYIQSAETISTLATIMGIDAPMLEKTIATYNRNVAKGVDPEFGRQTNLLPIDQPPFYIAATGNAITSTYGGITTDGTMAVVDWFGIPIDGLFAAGEVVGGFHGGGYYSASSLSSSATFGREAGLRAARVSA
ncbi:FAD-dependent oxidoreductase [Hyphomonas chukchiensis]|nr:FAD-dependent oxidoreductase [Hyphomonas chukchiensis]|tara:strand:- start:52612 stop:54009 length:1398 start_codon:yes stop_codon:yes gene_type:complete